MEIGDIFLLVSERSEQDTSYQGVYKFKLLLRMMRMLVKDPFYKWDAGHTNFINAFIGH